MPDFASMFASLPQEYPDPSRENLLAQVFAPPPVVPGPVEPAQTRGQGIAAMLADIISGYAAARVRNPSLSTNAMSALDELRRVRAEQQAKNAERAALSADAAQRGRAEYELASLEKERERTLQKGARQEERLYDEKRDRAAAQAKAKAEADERKWRETEAAKGRAAEMARAKMYDETRQEISDLRKTLADDKVGRAKLDEQDKILAATRQEALDIKRIGRLNPDGKTRTPLKPEELAAAKADFLDDAEAAGLEGPYLKLAEEWWDRKVGVAPEAGPVAPPEEGASVLRPYDKMWADINAARR